MLSIFTLGAPVEVETPTCSGVTFKSDCGFVGIDQPGCEAKGCCWQPSSADGNDPWCFRKAEPHANSCFVMPAKTLSDPPFADDEVAKIRSNFEANIGVQGTGAVVAAPDHNTPGGSYYYHWERDGALSYTALQTAGLATDARMKAYAEWVIGRQAESDPHNIDVRTEPKYEIPSGTVYSGAWCRPQNDGPGLRANALLLFADKLMASGQSSDAAYVSSQLWAADGSGAIQRDLAYLTAGGWSSNTCDLWEEVRSSDFLWNKLSMKRALLHGAAFATARGDAATAASYKSTAAAIASALASSSHFTGDFIFESTNREVDGAVIVALNYGFDDDAPVYAATSLEVASTVRYYNKAFCAEYPINVADSASKLPGVLYGRYPGDHYAGGNPWVLLSAALAQLLYRVAHTAKATPITDATTLQAWADALSLPSLASADAAAQLFAAGDAVLLRVREHVKDDGFRLDEQIDKNSGKQVSAKSLTWSYAEVINALTWRAAAAKGLRAPEDFVENVAAA